jgi:hypothetical protein
MVHATDMNIDSSIKRELKNLAILQENDPRLQAIKGGPTTHTTARTKYLVNNDVLYCKGDRQGQNWKAMLPECLEQKVMKFVHTSLWHLRNDKCYAEINNIFHVKNLATCDFCQKTKHMNSAYNVEEKLSDHTNQVIGMEIVGATDVDGTEPSTSSQLTIAEAACVPTRVPKVKLQRDGRVLN